jgi:hypothetical protein
VLNVVNSDQSVGETSEEFLTSRVPSNRSTSGKGLFLGLFSLGNFGLDVGDGFVVVLVRLDIPDFNSVFSTGSDPLESWVESNRVNGASSVQLKVGGGEIGDVPDVEVLVLSSSGNVLGVGGDSASVDVSFVSLEREFVSEVGVPDFQESIPSNGGDVRLNGGFSGSRGFRSRGVSDAADPVVVVSGFRGVFAFSFDVPELDRVVSTSGEDPSGVMGETGGEDFSAVIDESVGSLSGSEIPESEGFVPRRGDGEGVVGRKGNIADEMFMSGKGFEG